MCNKGDLLLSHREHLLFWVSIGVELVEVEPLWGTAGTQAKPGIYSLYVSAISVMTSFITSKSLPGYLA